jgi:tRNA(Arg) A34 adenosine deaminase TadA
MNSQIFDALFAVAKNTDRVANAKMAAAVVRRNKIVSIGVNSRKSNPFTTDFQKHPEAIFPHCEVDAIRIALRNISEEDISKCDLYISRAKLNKRGGEYVTGLAKPCEGCMKAIMKYRPRNVFYTTETDEIKSLDY